MSIASYFRRPACTATDTETLRDAAQRMEKQGVGLLAVVEGSRLAGVLTDRDVALHVVAEGRDGSVARVCDAMSSPALALDPEESLQDALDQMARGRVRRLPVADADGVHGVVSADDLTLLLAREIGGLGEVLVGQLPAGASRTSERAKGAPRREVGHYGREVVTARSAAPVQEIARSMRDRGIGSVVVVDEEGRARGLVTDRDLAMRVVASGRDPGRTAASAVMSTPLVTATPTEPLEQLVARMQSAGVRRIPVLREGHPVGIVTFDDLLVTFGQELEQLADCVASEIRETRIQSASTRVRHELETRLEDAAGRLREMGDQTLRGLGRELEQVLERAGQALRGPRLRAREAPLQVRDLMRSEVRTCTPEDALTEPARIMWEHDCGCVPVLASDGSGRVVGMITDRDICIAAYTAGAPLGQMQVRSAMAGRVHACHPEDPLSEAEGLMRAAQVRRLPVVDAHGHLSGILSLADVAEAAAGVRAPAGAVSAAEVGLALESICRPRTALVRAEEAP